MDENLVQIGVWLGGGFFLIISGLLTWIGIMQRETKAVITKKNDEQDKRLDNHDVKFEKVHEEIKDIVVSIAANMKRRK